MISERQARKLRKLLAIGKSLAAAARKTGMDEKTARKYRDQKGTPAENQAPRNWRTRTDPFLEVWSEVQEKLQAEPKLQACTLFTWLQDKYPQQFPDSQRRTFERRVRSWRAQHGPNQEVVFPQIHHPGELAASDFTSMNDLKITIGKQPFEHLLFHFTLTYSNWETASICFSESFEALSRGWQQACWELGGVPQKHRSDSLSAAVNNLSSDRVFRARYQDLMDHYQVQPQRINVRKPQENGDVESSHGHLKNALDQALLLRGSRDFESREDYQQFLDQVIQKRNHGRGERFQQELAHLGDLPPSRLDHRRRIEGIKVRSSSTITIQKNTYSVPSRLIGHRVDVLIDAETIEVFYADTLVQTMPRLCGDGKHAIHYRHVIDSLVRKPGAFAQYQYREDLFPSSLFRMAYDELLRAREERAAVREYLKILQLAARDSQDAVQDALRQCLSRGEEISSAAIAQAIETPQTLAAATEVHIEPPDLQPNATFAFRRSCSVEWHCRLFSTGLAQRQGPQPCYDLFLQIFAEARKPGWRRNLPWSISCRGETFPGKAPQAQPGKVS